MPSIGNAESPNRPAAGFLEVEHTADWELTVWAPDFPTLLDQAARGMYALAGMRLRTNPRQSRAIELHARDQETLLVNFLSELLYYYEKEGLGFDHFEIESTDNHIYGIVSGASVDSMDKEIKAVTFHNLRVKHLNRGLEVNIVFDV